MRYRRAFVPGGTWFFTLVTSERRKIFETPDSIAILRDAFRSVRRKPPFAIDAIVVLPDHIHCILTLPENDANFPKRMIRDETDYQHHVDYIHYNPVKHGYVDDPASWTWSSIHRFIERGLLPLEWGKSTVYLPDGVGCE